MGWLIVTLVLMGIGIFLVHKYGNWDSMLQPDGIWISLVGFTVASVLIVCMSDLKPYSEKFIEKYDNLITLTHSVQEPSDAIIEEIIETNDEIISHRVRSKNFMTKGLYSKDIAELNLLEIPEWYSKSE